MCSFEMFIQSHSKHNFVFKHNLLKSRFTFKHVLKLLYTHNTETSKNEEAIRLTVFFVEHNFHLELRLAFKSRLDGEFVFLLRFWAIKEFAGAPFLHDLGTRVAGEFTKAIAAVYDGIEGADLCVPQHEVTVCGERDEI